MREPNTHTCTHTSLLTLYPNVCVCVCVCVCVVACAGLLPCSFQGGARGPSALVLHHHLQRRQALHEEQAAGEGEIHTHTCLSPLTHTHICLSSHTHTHLSLITHTHTTLTTHTFNLSLSP